MFCCGKFARQTVVRRPDQIKMTEHKDWYDSDRRLMMRFNLNNSIPPMKYGKDETMCLFQAVGWGLSIGVLGEDQKAGRIGLGVVSALFLLGGISSHNKKRDMERLEKRMSKTTDVGEMREIVEKQESIIQKWFYFSRQNHSSFFFSALTMSSYAASPFRVYTITWGNGSVWQRLCWSRCCFPICTRTSIKVSGLILSKPVPSAGMCSVFTPVAAQ